jgi:Transposase DDE domain group 1
MGLVEGPVSYEERSTLQVNMRIGSYPPVRVQGDGGAVVSQAGGVLLAETVRKTGLDTAISAALMPWRKPRAVHDPGKVLLDLALAETTTALGEACVVDRAELRPELPGFLVPHGHTEASWLRHLAEQGVEFGADPRLCPGPPQSGRRRCRRRSCRSRP